MAVINVKGVIKYKVKKNHPDLKYIDEAERNNEFEFCDIYHIDTDCFWCKDAIDSYIKHDLALVAGGGYDTDTIKNLKFIITYGVNSIDN